MKLKSPSNRTQRSITAAATELLSHPYNVQSIFQKLIPTGSPRDLDISGLSGNILVAIEPDNHFYIVNIKLFMDNFKIPKIYPL